ncbi:MAG: adenylate/guanylate cyclase domain-containing protein [Candidatus Bipolaricaulota bacterium]|nr:adenylate/guanylate cyclase domain-containing protein [Candidatus Bipolaricaulota bacterium]
MISLSTRLKNWQLIRQKLESGEAIAVMFSDIRGFVSYTAREGDHAAYRLAQIHNTLLKEKIEEQGGIIVKILGDGIMAAFASPIQGVKTAVLIQRHIRDRNLKSLQEPIDVGIGLASGTPVMTESDMIGHSVNLSQRISNLAKSGQILVTEKIKGSTYLSDGLHYIPVGRPDLKGLGKIRVYEVAWMAEVARLSGEKNKITLILTERGTIVIELAKEIQEQLEKTMKESDHLRREEAGVFASFLQRVISRGTKLLIDRSLSAFGIGREIKLDKVTASLRGKNLRVAVGRRDFYLEGADPVSARAFVDRIDELKRRAKEPRRKEG